MVGFETGLMKTVGGEKNNDECLGELRRFALHVYINASALGLSLPVETFREFNLVDENGKPTYILTGQQ